MKALSLRVLAVACCLVILASTMVAPGVALGQTEEPPPVEGGWSSAQAAAAVQTWVRSVPAAARPDAVVDSIEPFIANGRVAAYIVHLQGGGFALASAHPALLPVYFYSPAGNYSDDSPSYRFILEEIAARTEIAQQTLASTAPETQALRDVLASRAADWTELMAGHAPARAAAPAAPDAEPGYLLLRFTPHWHQGAPYYDFLPTLSNDDEHTVVGCNATATAQIMYYWKWPTTGVGSNCISYPYRWRSDWDSTPLTPAVTIPSGFSGRLSYNVVTSRLLMSGYWDDSVYQAAQTISGDSSYQTALATLWSRMTQTGKLACANFSSSTYNWSIMKDNNAEPRDAAGDQAARVSADVSIAVESGLGIWNTGSYFGNDAAGLSDHFRYDPDALFTAVATVAGITAEIPWGRPAGLGGSGPAGGHAWVVDGYDKSTDPNRLFHMNLGWGGGSDGWYTFDSAPFPSNHDMLTRVAPLSVRFVDVAGTAGDGSPNSPYNSITAAVGAAPYNSTLMLKAGNEYNFSGQLVIDHPLLLDGYGATIR